MNFKKSLAFTLSALIVSNTAFAATDIKQESTSFTKVSCTQKINNTLKNAGRKVIRFVKNHPILASAMVVPAIPLAIFSKNFAKAAWYYVDFKGAEITYRVAFKGITGKNTITPRQEGHSWCAIACLTGLLKDKGIKVEQKDIYKNLFKTSWVPIFECNRKRGGLSTSPMNKEEINQLHDANLDKVANSRKSDSVYQSQFDEYVRKVSKNKLRCQKLYIPYNIDQEHTINAIKSILKKYKKVAITDSFNLKSGAYHCVNIVNIDNDKDTITVEDPVGLSRVQNIKDYVSEYNSKFIDADKDSYFDVYFDPGIDIEIVTENENVYKNGDIENVFYIDPKNCSEGISLLKKQYNIGTIKTFTIKS